MSRLSSVLRLRRLTERQAKGRLAGAQRDAGRAAGAVDDRRRAVADRPRPEGTLTPTQLRALELQGVRSVELVREALAVQEQADRRRAEAAQGLQQAAVATRSTERLVERREAESAQVARVAAQRALDELALLLHGGRRS